MTSKKVDLTQRLSGKVAVVTRRRQRDRSGRSPPDACRRSHDRRRRHRPRDRPAGCRRTRGTFVAVDVSEEAAVNNLFDTAASTYGSVDIAFNNAGISPPGDDLIETTELPAWQRVQDVNLKSVYLCCRAALRHMVPAGNGSIINTASLCRGHGISHVADLLYRLQGWGAGHVPELGVQFARQGIRVNALCRGR